MTTEAQPLRMVRVLLVEDETNVGSTLGERLRHEGYDVTWARSLSEARTAVRALTFALALLDVGLPDGSGFELAAEIRAMRGATAIIFLTARSDADDRVRGLELGAEDYVVKPFHLKELLLRIERSLTRAAKTSEDSKVVRIGEALVSFSAFSAEAGGHAHTLTHKECDLLRLLVERRGSVVSRDEILDRVWSQDEFPSPRTVDNFIVRLRKLVEIDPEAPSVIRNVRGVGYVLERVSSDEPV